MMTKPMSRAEAFLKDNFNCGGGTLEGSFEICWTDKALCMFDRDNMQIALLAIWYKDGLEIIQDKEVIHYATGCGLGCTAGRQG